MNFLAHAFRHLDRPYFVAGTAVPDWLSVVDRKIRAKSRYAEPFARDVDEEIRDTALGIMQHHRDDNWFHGSLVFNETMLEFAIELRDRLAGDEGFRPSFVGHILVEVLIDATLLQRQPSIGTRFYEAMNVISWPKIERLVNQMTQASTDQLVPTIQRFTEARFLYDYLQDDKLLFRLNQVMKRVKLPELPESLTQWFPAARQIVADRCNDLIQPE